MHKKIKVFTIDDSPIYRQVYREIITSDPDLEYLGYASNGALAIEKLKVIDPDIITLDIEMPEMDGIETLKYIMTHFPKPVIMISSFTTDGADVTFKALELGAVDYIEKPKANDIKTNIFELEELLLLKLKVFADFQLPQKKRFKQVSMNDGIPDIGGLPSFAIPRTIKHKVDIICIGASTGGTVALSTILPRIKPNIGVPILIVQHMPVNYTNSFANRLDSLCSLKVSEASDETVLEPNNIYIAHGGYHLEVHMGKVRLTNSPPVNNHRPSVDVLFNSALETYKGNMLAVILTGMGSDGAKGIAAIKDAGGYTVAQDEESSVIFGMPGSAIKTGRIDRIVPLDRMAQFINDYVGHTNK